MVLLKKAKLKANGANMADPYKQAAEKLDKETKAEQVKQQANADKTWENLHTGKIPAPTEPDQDPFTKKYKKGGSIMEHKHHVDHLKQHHTEGQHKHHSEHYDAHKASHKVHHEHVKSMCGGGKIK